MRVVFFMFLIILLSATASAQSFNRAMSMVVDGEIDYLSQMGGGAGEVVLEVKGEGSLELDLSSSFSSDSFRYELDGQSSGLVMTTGVRLYTDDIYVSKLEGDTEFEYDYYALINTFPTIDISTNNYVLGSLQRRIDMSNNGLWIDERFSATGAIWVLDHLRYTPEDEE